MLKIKPEHYETLRIACEDLLEQHPDAREKYKAQGLSAKRFRWDVLHAVRVGELSGTAWLCTTLYPYLTDEHVDSALRKIVG